MSGEDAVSDEEKPPMRGPRHDALDVFLGSWKAEGVSYGGTDQTGTDPKANGVPWTSTHKGCWHTGRFFLIQDEKALPGGVVFDTLSIMGVDAITGEYFARTFENHGFYRNYKITVDNRIWHLIGDTERCRIEFSSDSRKQTLVWEWKPGGRRLPLCDRTAVRTE